MTDLDKVLNDLHAEESGPVKDELETLVEVSQTQREILARLEAQYAAAQMLYAENTDRGLPNEDGEKHLSELKKILDKYLPAEERARMTEKEISELKAELDEIDRKYGKGEIGLN